MQPDHIRRTRDAGGDGVDVEIRRVSREDRTRLADAIEFGEHGLFDRHVLEHGLDDQIDGGERVIGGAARPPAHCRGLVFGRHAALRNQAVIDLFDVCPAASQRRFIAFHHGDGEAGVERRDCDPRAHCAAADHTDARDAAWPGRARFRRLEYFAFGEECVDQASPLGAVDALQEQLALMAQAVVE